VGENAGGAMVTANIAAERKRAVWRLVKLSIITGLVVAVGFLPMVAASGMAAKAGADGFTTLPANFSLPPVPDASTLYASDGKTIIATFGDQYRIQSKSDDIAKVMKEAIVATEDVRFYEHNGVDSKGIARALLSNFTSGEVTEGASTITMQYVRQVLAYNAASEEELAEATATTPERKLREMRYAVAVEEEMSKDQILTNYLNTVYFGHGAYGVGAAAKVYFAKNADELNLNEAATLAGLVQSPSEYDPISGDVDAATDRRNHVLNRMADTDYAAADDVAKLVKTEIPLDPGELPGDSVGVDGSEYGFFADYFEQWWSKQKRFGDSAQERLSLLSRGGYRIVSSLDVDLQKTAEDAIAAEQRKDSPYALGSVVVEPGSGQVKVMAVNRNYSADDSKAANTTNPLLTGGSDFAGYQAGSTFKMFTMLAALDAGMPLSTSMYSPQRYTSKYVGGAGTSACGIHWCPSNADPSMTGNQTMWSAFGKSVNTYFVQLEEKVGADKAVAMAEKLGLTWHTDADREQADNAEDWGAFTLGVSSSTPIEIAAAYATVVADGKYAEPTPVSTMYDGNGTEISFEPKTKQVIDKDIARAAVDAARCPTGYGASSGSCGGWSTGSQVSGTVGGPVGGKTGTTDGDSTAWFAGFTPNLAIASFMADPADPNHLLQSGMTTKPINVSSTVLAAGWQADPSGDFKTPSQKMVGQGSSDGGQEGNPGQGGDDWPNDGGQDPETPGTGGPGEGESPGPGPTLPTEPTSPSEPSEPPTGGERFGIAGIREDGRYAD
jgi:membrane peptidoglycan carboxypeptidase